MEDSFIRFLGRKILLETYSAFDWRVISNPTRAGVNDAIWSVQLQLKHTPPTVMYINTFQCFQCYSVLLQLTPTMTSYDTSRHRINAYAWWCGVCRLKIVEIRKWVPFKLPNWIKLKTLKQWSGSHTRAFFFEQQLPSLHWAALNSLLLPRPHF